MGIVNGAERAVAALDFSTATVAASGAVQLRGMFNLSVWGSFTGLALQVERSFDGGATWLPLTRAGVPVVFDGPASEVGEAPEDGVLYRVNVTAIASGTVNARLSR